MSQSSVEAGPGNCSFQNLAKQMLSYRWVCYGMLLLTYIFVYFDRVAPAVIAPELMKEFGLYGYKPWDFIFNVFLSLCCNADSFRHSVRPDGPKDFGHDLFHYCGDRNSALWYRTQFWDDHLWSFPDGSWGSGSLDTLYENSGQLVSTQGVCHSHRRDAYGG